LENYFKLHSDSEIGIHLILINLINLKFHLKIQLLKSRFLKIKETLPPEPPVLFNLNHNKILIFPKKIIKFLMKNKISISILFP